MLRIDEERRLRGEERNWKLENWKYKLKYHLIDQISNYHLPMTNDRIFTKG